MNSGRNDVAPAKNEKKISHEEKKAAKLSYKKDKAKVRKEKKKLSQRVDEWNVKDDVLDRIINIMIALVTLCVLMTLGFVTLSYQHHLVTILLVPLLVYLSFSAPSVKLRLRERRSMLLCADVLSICYVLGICLAIDAVCFKGAENVVAVILLCIVGLAAYMGFIFRQRIMYYAMIPFTVVYTAGLLIITSFDPAIAFAAALLSAMVYLMSARGHGFYFGIGRACREGEILKLPESEAKIVRAQEKERIRKLDADIKRREQEARAQRAEARRAKKEASGKK